MAASVPQKLQDLFQFDRPIVATLVTLMPDGAPQATPVWFLYEDDYIVVNTARGRQKDRNMQRDAKVALTIIDPKDPYHWAEVRGKIADIVEATGDRDIDRLSLKYTGNAEYQFRKQSEVRVTYKIELQKVNGS
jgi:PPOX class probable F420-dependent enzyme